MNRENDFSPDRGYPRGQRGGAVFYTFVVTPLALGLLLLTIDLAKWNSSREYLLQQSERIALHSTQALPNRERAQAIGSELISRLASEGIVGTVSHSTLLPDSLTVSLQTDIRGTFDTFLRTILNRPLSFQVEESTTTSLVPQDVVLILPAGSSMRPIAQAAAGTPIIGPLWGQPEEWPPSELLTHCIHSIDSSLNPIHKSVWDYYLSDRESAGHMTAQCYNPTFSAVKLFALYLVDHLSEARMNRLGVIFFGGSEASRISTIRHLASTSTLNDSNSVPHAGGFFERDARGYVTEAEAIERKDIDPRNGAIADRNCVLLANQWIAPTARYQIPENPFHRVRETEILNSSPCGASFSPLNPTLFRPDFFQHELLLREAVYYRAAPHPLVEARTGADFVQALENAAGEFRSTDLEVERQTEGRRRGKLLSRTQRRLIAVTDILTAPLVPRLVNAIQVLQSTRVNIAIIVLAHQGVPSYETRNSLREFDHVRDIISQSADTFEIIRAPDPNTLATQLAPWFANRASGVVVRR